MVTQEQPAHFAIVDSDAVWPSYNHLPAAANPRYDHWYSLVYGSHPWRGHQGRMARHPARSPIRTGERSTPEPVQLAALQRYAREWLPGVDPTRRPDQLYLHVDADADFVLDRTGPIVVGAGFSGHGFKFVPTVGRILADLVDGTARPAALFSLRGR